MHWKADCIYVDENKWDVFHCGFPLTNNQFLTIAHGIPIRLLVLTLNLLHSVSPLQSLTTAMIGYVQRVVPMNEIHNMNSVIHKTNICMYTVHIPKQKTTFICFVSNHRY